MTTRVVHKGGTHVPRDVPSLEAPEDRRLVAATARPGRCGRSSAGWKRSKPQDPRPCRGEASPRHATALAEIDVRWANLRSGPRALSEREAHEFARPVPQRLPAPRLGGLTRPCRPTKVVPKARETAARVVSSRRFQPSSHKGERQDCRE